MTRIKSCFERLQQQGRKALIPYITAGDPNPGATVPLMHAMVEAGADLLELGVPFSDPMADGPVIQLACERALKHNMSLLKVLGIVAEFRQKDRETPVVLMGYLNPVEALGAERFAQLASESGVDGVLTVDLPPEESDSLVPTLKSHGMDAVFLLAPTTTDERVKLVCEQSGGYVYYVSLKGVTGSNKLDISDVSNKLKQIRELTDLPVGVGFGIRDAESAKAVATVADAVIVGSVLVNAIAENEADQKAMITAVSDLVATMRRAIDEARK